jgi:hypothetical protein
MAVGFIFVDDASWKAYMRNNSMYFYKQVITELCIKSLDAKFKNQKVALYFRTGHYVHFKKNTSVF